MAISVLLKAVTRRGSQSLSAAYESVSRNVKTSSSSSLLGKTSTSNFESVFRNVNTPWNNSLSGKMSSSLGTRAFCSKSDPSDSVAQNKFPESNLTKVVFKYVCGHDEFRENSRSSQPIIRKVLEIPRGHTFFECKDGDDVSYCNLIDFCYSLMRRLKEDAESARGERVTEMCFIEASFFKDRIRSIIDSSGAILNLNGMIDCLEKPDSFSNGKNSRTRCKLTIDVDEYFDIRTWEKITSGDKHVLEIILSELKKNGFDFNEDPVALQKIEEAVERAMMRMTNMIKLNLPVPVGKPDMSTTISWEKCAGLPILKTVSPDSLILSCLK
ncbi:uncharacterized protein LOC113329234 [Papaver somniferum]|uniref:uncharacterized protein LOC113329234 n=1 Tax=Papaver somniferum TaxID=3469 RepID=UPI000E6F754F|nr:uncharacterized protein LOC113329234 [Papaver somniferum]